MTASQNQLKRSIKLALSYWLHDVNNLLVKQKNSSSKCAWLLACAVTLCLWSMTLFSVLAYTEKAWTTEQKALTRMPSVLFCPSARSQIQAINNSGISKTDQCFSKQNNTMGHKPYFFVFSSTLKSWPLTSTCVRFMVGGRSVAAQFIRRR